MTTEQWQAGGIDASLAVRRPLRILIAEDSMVGRLVILRMLAGFGYQADVAQDGLEVLAATAGKAYDLLLMDVHMPKMDGLEATRALRERDAGRRQPRIVALTASVAPEELRRCLAAGMDAWSAKPLEADELRRVLEACEGFNE